MPPRFIAGVGHRHGVNASRAGIWADAMPCYVRALLRDMAINSSSRLYGATVYGCRQCIMAIALYGSHQVIMGRPAHGRGAGRKPNAFIYTRKHLSPSLINSSPRAAGPVLGHEHRQLLIVQPQRKASGRRSSPPPAGPGRLPPRHHLHHHHLHQCNHHLHHNSSTALWLSSAHHGSTALYITTQLSSAQSAGPVLSH